VRVVAVDIAGNKSAPSAAATATALLIDDAHISDLTVSKVTAGTISADWIVGARIKTAVTGTRVELNSAGLQAYNSAGDQTVNIAATDGSVSIIGQLKSGTSGRRIEINPTATYLPEIRFYASSGSNYGFINAVSSGAEASVGLNSGTFTAASQSLYERLFMFTDGIQLAQVKSSDSSKYGGYVGLSTAGSSMGQTDGTNDYYYAVSSTGLLGMRGHFAGFTAANPADALFTAILSISSVSGLTVTYGATMASSMAPMVSLFDSGALKTTQITGSTSTDFTATFSATATGYLNCWVFRV
jgi:hypothetical protein